MNVGIIHFSMLFFTDYKSRVARYCIPKNKAESGCVGIGGYTLLPCPAEPIHKIETVEVARTCEKCVEIGQKWCIKSMLIVDLRFNVWSLDMVC